jgi:two-component system, cell cycle response regulator DivK
MPHAAPAPPIILIVDDFDDALDIYQQYLTFKGYHVITARSGQEAIDAARRRRPAVIFMDLSMAVMTGTEAMRVLRSDATFSHVPIVAFTAHALQDERLTALHAGFDEVLAKPCLPDELVAAVARLLATPRRAQLSGLIGQLLP